MKKPEPPEDPDSASSITASAIPALEPASAPADKRDGRDRQPIVISALEATPVDTMERVQTREPERHPDDDIGRRASLPWDDNSGEGAASALELLRRLEQSRVTIRPPKERPVAE